MAAQLACQPRFGLGHRQSSSGAPAHRHAALRVAPVQQRAVIAHASFPDGLVPSFDGPPSSKGVFQHPSLAGIDNVEVVDARDAFEACYGLNGEAKEACYLLFGCEAQGVEKYLNVVEGLEHALQSEPDPLESCWRFKS